MKTLKPNEVKLVGNWIVKDDIVKKDKISIRIEWLTSKVLKEVGYSKEFGAWEILYIDPNDGRYWLKKYPKSFMHGGGPPILENVSINSVKGNFSLI